MLWLVAGKTSGNLPHSTDFYGSYVTLSECFLKKESKKKKRNCTDLGIGWGKTGFTQVKTLWVPPRAFIYGLGTYSDYCWITRVLPDNFAYKNPSSKAINNVISNAINGCIIMYTVGDEKISGEFRLYFDYLSEDSNDFIGYRGLKTLFRQLPEIRPVTVDNLGT
jgi:hypothetical protein